MKKEDNKQQHPPVQTAPKTATKPSARATPSNKTLFIKRHYIGLVVLLVVSLGLFVACNSSQKIAETPPVALRTWLLVRAPDAPLPLNKTITVQSRTEDSQGVSHVELYAVQLPTGESNLVLDSQAAPFNQTTFSAAQTIIPTQRGHYAIKVVGYNKRGEQAESETISFDIE
ncbi:hypothetical protein QUF64_16245 [Anaerolineales bacterium HSG6]|nr:hypothetical protein [Anaerolineales bacterium HSG6]MDM8532190.1 hypothetical protein [Anaerolineales bacterium HSG25]